MFCSCSYLHKVLEKRCVFVGRPYLAVVLARPAERLSPLLPWPVPPCVAAHCGSARAPPPPSAPPTGHTVYVSNKVRSTSVNWSTFHQVQPPALISLCHFEASSLPPPSCASLTPSLHISASPGGAPPSMTPLLQLPLTHTYERHRFQSLVKRRLF